MTREQAIDAAGQAFAEALADMQRQGIPLTPPAESAPKTAAPRRNRAKRTEPKREAA